MISAKIFQFYALLNFYDNFEIFKLLIKCILNFKNSWRWSVDSGRTEYVLFRSKNVTTSLWFYSFWIWDSKMFWCTCSELSLEILLLEREFYFGYVIFVKKIDRNRRVKRRTTNKLSVCSHDNNRLFLILSDIRREIFGSLCNKPHL